MIWQLKLFLYEGNNFNHQSHLQIIKIKDIFTFFMKFSSNYYYSLSIIYQQVNINSSFYSYTLLHLRNKKSFSWFDNQNYFYKKTIILIISHLKIIKIKDTSSFFMKPSPNYYYNLSIALQPISTLIILSIKPTILKK